MKVPIWEGIYDSFQTVPVQGDGFDGERWVENSLIKIKALRDGVKEGTSISTVLKYRESLLPVIAVMVYHRLGRLEILDFGGGIGFTFYQVAQSLPDIDGLRYHVVDREKVCEAGKEFFRDELSIQFHTGLSSDIEKVEIIHMGSSLQYIDSWRDLLAELCSYTDGYFLFTDLMAGDIPTFVTAQNYYGSKIPFRFYNLSEVIQTMSEHGFEVILKSVYSATFVGVEQELPQENLAVDYRLGNSCNLLLAKRRGI